MKPIQDYLNALKNDEQHKETARNYTITYKRVYSEFVIISYACNDALTPSQINTLDAECNQLRTLEAMKKRRTLFRKIFQEAADAPKVKETPEETQPQYELCENCGNYNKEVTKDPITGHKTTLCTSCGHETGKTQETPAETPAAPIKVETPTLGLDAIIGGIVKGAIEQNAQHIDVKVQEYLDKNGIRPQTKNIIVKRPDAPPVEMGQQHEKFEDVLTAVAARQNTFLSGQAGTGKSTIPEMVAKALGLEFGYISLCGATPPSALFGYMDANGNYSETIFYNRYKNGGVFLLDEIDAGNPNTTLSANNAASSGFAAFPCGMVKKHENFILIATANTWGKGANAEYVGRAPIDAATLNRFVKIPVDLDEKLEESLSSNKEWLKIVRDYRKRAEQKKVRVMITQRATLQGQSLIAAGMSIEKAIEYTILAGLNEDERNLLKR